MSNVDRQIYFPGFELDSDLIINDYVEINNCEITKEKDHITSNSEVSNEELPIVKNLVEEEKPVQKKLSNVLTKMPLTNDEIEEEIEKITGVNSKVVYHKKRAFY